MNDSLKKLQTLRGDLPEFSPGDTIRVDYKVVEGDKERVQPFQGTVMGKSGGGTNETFIVRRVLQGVGVERIFPLQSPFIKNIKVIKKGVVKRAKLNYLRKAKGRQARIKELKKTTKEQSPAGAKDVSGGETE
jgi:large subunit ribosomal protein L19